MPISFISSINSYYASSPFKFILKIPMNVSILYWIPFIESLYKERSGYFIYSTFLFDVKICFLSFIYFLYPQTHFSILQLSSFILFTFLNENTWTLIISLLYSFYNNIFIIQIFLTWINEWFTFSPFNLLKMS